MSTFEEERERDFAAYERLKAEIVAKHRGQYVAIADGRLIKVAPTFQEAWDAVKRYRHRLVFQAGSEPIRSVAYLRSPVVRSLTSAETKYGMNAR